MWFDLNEKISINLDKLLTCYSRDYKYSTDDETEYSIYWINGQEERSVTCSSKEERDIVFKNLQKALHKNKKKGNSMITTIKDYFKKHEETFITLAILLLVDEYLFEGKFRDKIKEIMDSIITKTKRDVLKDEVKE